MFKRLLQAATLTFLLNLAAHLNPPETTQPISVSASISIPKLVVSSR